MKSHKTHLGSKANAGEGERTFGLLFERHPIPMFVYDLKTWAILEVNLALVEKYGYSRVEFQSLTLKDILPTAEAARLLKLVKKKQPDLVYTGEWQHQLKDGRVLDVDITSHTLDIDGHAAGLVMAQDITERKQAEQILRESEKRFNSLFNGTLDGIYRSTPEGKFIAINQAMVNMFGYSSMEEMLQVDIIQKLYFSPEERHGNTESAITAEPEVFRMRRKNGTEIWVEDHETYIHNEQGKIIYHGGILRDVTKRKQAEEALRKSEERYHLLFDGMLDGYYRSTHAGKFVDVNPAMVKMFGYSSKKEMLEVDIKKELYFSPEERGSHILDSGQGETDIFRMRRKDGSEIWVEDRGFYIYDEQGMAIFHEGSLREITQRKQAEDELRRAKESLEVMNMELRFAFENEQNMARTDVLTGINNRRNLFDLAEHEFEVAKRYRQPLSIIMFDIDYFKQINDSFGHALGDKMLQRVAQVAHAQLRDVDMIGRYGGEEFVIVLPVTSANKAYLVAQRILESVAAIRLNTDQGSAAVTLSIGIAEILHTPPDGSVDNLIHRADEALLSAKQAGRNRAMLFGPDQMREI